MTNSTAVRLDDREQILNIINNQPKHAQIIVAIIPAYNEADCIAHTIASVRAQSELPTVIIVAANNCSDGTERVAREAGALVFLAEPNRHKKGGALNLTLDFVMPLLKSTDRVLVMDGDTTLSENFIETALTKLVDGVGGVGGAFIGRPTTSMIGTLQQMEYHRYRKDIVRRGERAFVLSGTGTLFSVAALRAVKSARDGRTLPLGDGYYDTASLTEDNEITFALMKLGYECVSPVSMTTTTDVMETLPKLWGQRERWYLGALWNLRNYGRRMPWYMRWVYWRQQIGLMVVSLTMVIYFVSLAVSVYIGASITLQPIWTALTLVVIVERAWSVWTMGWKARLLVLCMVEQLYAMYLCSIFLAALVKCSLNNKGSWKAT